MPADPTAGTEDRKGRERASAAPSGLRYTLLALLFTFLWASAFIAVKVALRSSPPFFLMASRFIVAGVLLLSPPGHKYGDVF